MNDRVPAGDKMPLTVETLQTKSRERAVRWHGGKPAWSLLEWAGAASGENGEVADQLVRLMDLVLRATTVQGQAANTAKKIKRLEQEMPNFESEAANPAFIPATHEAWSTYRQKLCKEACDAIFYNILLIDEAGGDVEFCLRDVFNQKSEEYGFPERI